MVVVSKKMRELADQLIKEFGNDSFPDHEVFEDGAQTLARLVLAGKTEHPHQDPQPLKPGMLIFFEANGEEAAPGWYRVMAFDHEHSREFPEDGWWWTCKRLCDGLMQTVSEKSLYLHTQLEGAPQEGLLADK